MDTHAKQMSEVSEDRGVAQLLTSLRFEDRRWFMMWREGEVLVNC